MGVYHVNSSGIGWLRAYFIELLDVHNWMLDPWSIAFSSTRENLSKRERSAGQTYRLSEQEV
jgi:hypothetical protein